MPMRLQHGGSDEFCIDFMFWEMRASVQKAIIHIKVGIILSGFIIK